MEETKTNEMWVLSVRTSLPKKCERFGDMKLEMQCFDSFEKGREAFREMLQGLAFTKNAMFDKKGNIIHLNQYIRDNRDPDDDDDVSYEGYLSVKLLTKLRDGLHAAFSGENVKLGIKNGFYTDWMTAATVKGNSVEFRGDDDGPCNGYDPVLKTNIFSMEKPQDYYLYIDDLFGQDDASAELYIDLKKVSVL